MPSLNPPLRLNWNADIHAARVLSKNRRIPGIRDTLIQELSEEVNELVNNQTFRDKSFAELQPNNPCQRFRVQIKIKRHEVFIKTPNSQNWTCIYSRNNDGFADIDDVNLGIMLKIKDICDGFYDHTDTESITSEDEHQLVELERLSTTSEFDDLEADLSTDLSVSPPETPKMRKLRRRITRPTHRFNRKISAQKKYRKATLKRKERTLLRKQEQLEREREGIAREREVMYEEARAIREELRGLHEKLDTLRDPPDIEALTKEMQAQFSSIRREIADLKLSGPSEERTQRALREQALAFERKLEAALRPLREGLEKFQGQKPDERLQVQIAELQGKIDTFFTEEIGALRDEIASLKDSNAHSDLEEKLEAFTTQMREMQEALRASLESSVSKESFEKEIQELHSQLSDQSEKLQEMIRPLIERLARLEEQRPQELEKLHSEMAEFHEAIGRKLAAIEEKVSDSSALEEVQRSIAELPRMVDTKIAALAEQMSTIQEALRTSTENGASKESLEILKAELSKLIIQISRDQDRDQEETLQILSEKLESLEKRIFHASTEELHSEMNEVHRNLAQIKQEICDQLTSLEKKVDDPAALAAIQEAIAQLPQMVDEKLAPLSAQMHDSHKSIQTEISKSNKELGKEIEALRSELSKQKEQIPQAIFTELEKVLRAQNEHFERTLAEAIRPLREELERIKNPDEDLQSRLAEVTENLQRKIDMAALEIKERLSDEIASLRKAPEVESATRELIAKLPQMIEEKIAAVTSQMSEAIHALRAAQENSMSAEELSKRLDSITASIEELGRIAAHPELKEEFATINAKLDHLIRAIAESEGRGSEALQEQIEDFKAQLEALLRDDHSMASELREGEATFDDVKGFINRLKGDIESLQLQLDEERAKSSDLERDRFQIGEEKIKELEANLFFKEEEMEVFDSSTDEANAKIVALKAQIASLKDSYEHALSEQEERIDALQRKIFAETQIKEEIEENNLLFTRIAEAMGFPIPCRGDALLEKLRDINEACELFYDEIRSSANRHMPDKPFDLRAFVDYLETKDALPKEVKTWIKWFYTSSDRVTFPTPRDLDKDIQSRELDDQREMLREMQQILELPENSSKELLFNRFTEVLKTTYTFHVILEASQDILSTSSEDIDLETSSAFEQLPFSNKSIPEPIQFPPHVPNDLEVKMAELENRTQIYKRARELRKSVERKQCLEKRSNRGSSLFPVITIASTVALTLLSQHILSPILNQRIYPT